MRGIYKRINAIMKGRKAIIGKFGEMELLRESGPFAYVSICIYACVYLSGIYYNKIMLGCPEKKKN